MPRAKRDRDGIYQRRDRAGYWISYTDAQGRRKQCKVKANTLTQARDTLRDKALAAEKQRDRGYAPPGKETFAEVMPRYLSHQRARLTAAAYARTKGIVETHLKNSFGPVRLADIRRGDVQKYITERSAAVSPASVVRELNTLKHVLNLAVDWELIPLNPCKRIKPPRVPAGRVRYLQPTELRAVLEACPLWLRPIVALLVCTGMRRSELLGLRWLDVDRQGGRIMLPQTKNGTGRTVWLNALACQALDSVPRNGARPTDRVFPPSEHVSPENVSLAFLRSCRKVEIADFRLHDLRHTAASWLRMQGADIHTVAQLLGHKDLRMAARYQHLSPTYLQAAVKGLDTAFGPELAKLPALEERTNGDAAKTGQVSGNATVTIEPKNGYEQVQAAAS
jgi:integrase